MAKEAKEMAAVRLEPAARRKIKVLAARLRVRESDVIRYAIEGALAELHLLCDQSLEGRDLVAAFVERGSELGRLLDLDVPKLSAILNEDLVDESKRVPREDVAMLLGGRQTKDYVDWLVRVSTGKDTPPTECLEPKTYLKAKYPDLRVEEAIEEHLEEQDRFRRGLG